MTNTTDIQINLDAFHAGCDWADSLKVGDTFRGSMGEARYRGLTGHDADMFHYGAIASIQSLGIYTTDDNTITQLDR